MKSSAFLFEPGLRRVKLPFASFAKRFAACLLTLVLIVSLPGCGAAHKGAVLAAPRYPVAAEFEDLDTAQEGYEEIDEGFLRDVTDFSFASASLVLCGRDRSQNTLYSPLSLYMALAVAVQGAQGNTRKELLGALRIHDVQMMDEQTGKLFRRLYADNEIGRLNLCNSLWLNKDAKYSKSFLQNAAKTAYAHIFSADFASEETPRRISRWVSQNTGGKLGNIAGGFAVNPQQVMMALNAVNFSDQWGESFEPSKTQAGKFTLPDGSKVDCDFMNASYGCHPFVGGEGYTASVLGFKNGLSMVFILPDQGTSPYDLLSDPTILEQAVNAIESDKRQTGEVIFKIPKFKLAADLNLADSIKRMGVKAAFDSAKADFARISDSKPLYLSEVKQSAVVSIDENGCEAAAFMQMTAACAVPPGETIEMVLDRPFLFAITGKAGGAPLFVGVVNNPAG